MKRNKSPGIPRKGYVSSNDTGSTGGSSAHSVGDVQQQQQQQQQQSLPPNNVKTTRHTRVLSQGSYPGAHQELAKNLGRTSSSSVEDHLNDEISTNYNRELSVNSCTNGSGVETNQSNLQNFSSTDELDSLIPESSDAQRVRAVIEHFHSKIVRTKEAIKAEQNLRDENVNEYLKLASNADKNQLQRIKSVFEKKNQKSAQTIAHLQKKLDNYNKKIKETEARGLHGTHHKQTREMLRDVGQGLKDVGVNIKEGITGLSGGVIGGIKSGIHTAGETVMTKPKEFFKHRFGSSENINSTEKSNIDENSASNAANVENGSTENALKYSVTQSGSQLAQSHSRSHSTKYTSDDESSSMTSGSGHLGPNKIASIGGSSSSPLRKHAILQAIHLPVTETTSPPALLDYEHIVTELKETHEECHRLSVEVESLKNQLQNECSAFHQNLQEERYRFERLEEQMNDLIELHQNEIENLKQNMADMEEKVQYQSEERLRDVHEMLESCQTRISRMEHQQHQHLQQLVNLDSLENSNARALVLKLINVVLTILQVVLLLVSTIANILTPFLQTRVRVVTSIIVLSIIMILFQQWPDFGSWTRQKISENWIHYSSTPPDSG